MCGAPSGTVTETVQGGSIAPPGTIYASPNPSTTGTYTVSWGPVNGATSYRIEEQVNGGSWSAGEVIGGPSRVYTGRPSGTYTYRVQACNASGCSGYSPTVTETVSIISPPGIPQGLFASPYYSLNGSFTMSWQPVATVPGAGGNTYRLEESTTPNTWTEVYDASATSWSTSNRVDGLYSYRVRACNNQGCSGYSATGYEVVRHVPDIPTGLNGDPNPSTGTFTLSWSASATATYYEVQEQLNGGAWTAVLDGGTLHGTSVTLTRGNGSYQYHVRACFFGDQVRCSVYSASWAQTVEGSTTPPAPASISGPSGCTASPRTYTISWDGVSQATSYDLHETNTSSPAEQILVTSATSQSLTRSRILPEDSTTYDYEVRACAGSGASRQCSPYRGTAHACVGIPNAVNGPQSATGSAYDAFGKARNGDYSDRPNGTLDRLPDTLRGFTAHQHVDAVQLIHMNGRIYDYQLGRFLSVDPVIQFPNNTQSLNPYSYIMNNPLSGRDPSGYEVDSRSICAHSPGACGEIYKTDSVSALAAISTNSSHEQPHDSMETTGPSSAPRSGNSAADIGNLSLAKGTIVAQNTNSHDLDPSVCAEMGGGYCEKETARRDSARNIADVASKTADVVDEVAVTAVETAVIPGGAAAKGALKAIEKGAAVLNNVRRASSAAKETVAAEEAFHYTFSKAVVSIEREGLRAGSYATPNGALRPLQAHIDLALSPNRGLPGALLRVDLAGLRQAGYEIPEISQVARSYGMPGGGFEMQFPYRIPPEFISVVRP